MRTALLRGREHDTLGGVAAEAEGSSAVTLSIGGARKRYDHTHPNEDAAAYAEGEGGILLAVADGHRGCEASEVALEQLLQHVAPRWTAAKFEPRGDWQQEAHEVLFALNQAVAQRVAEGPTPAARTTLVLALVRPTEDWLGFASAGDSHLFHVGEAEVVDLAGDGRRGSLFLGASADSPDALGARCVTGREGLAGTRALVLATDGLSERGIGVDHPEAAVWECAQQASAAPSELRALVAARAVAEQALDAQRRQRAGDNVASAVAWLAGETT